MKYIIPQDKIDKIVFKYLDTTLKRLEKREAKYFEGIVFAYPNKDYGILGWKNNGTLYIYRELIEEISSNFGMDKSDSKSIIGRWVSDRLQLEVTNTDNEFLGHSLKVSDRLQLEVTNTYIFPNKDDYLLATGSN